MTKKTAPTGIEDDRPILAIRLKWQDRRDLDDIARLDPDVQGRTDASRAAWRDYARKLRRKAERAA